MPACRSSTAPGVSAAVSRASIAAVAGGLCLLMAGCAGPPEGSAPRAAANPAVIERPGLSDNDRRFLVEAAGAANYRLEAARLAAQRARDPMLRAYVALLAQQVRARSDELAALMRSRGLPWLDGVPADRRATLDALAALADEVFDRRFIDKVGIADHQSDLPLFEAASAALDDPALRAWAADMVLVLRQSLASALQLPVRLQA